jgi:hypothetical protein
VIVLDTGLAAERTSSSTVQEHNNNTRARTGGGGGGAANNIIAYPAVSPTPRNAARPHYLTATYLKARGDGHNVMTADAAERMIIIIIIIMTVSLLFLLCARGDSTHNVHSGRRQGRAAPLHYNDNNIDLRLTEVVISWSY